ncbi:MAG: hypothetical protein GX969_05765 [Firmicutes bacterium]|nr:hypothetical protein [Bacillota bacterium]
MSVIFLILMIMVAYFQVSSCIKQGKRGELIAFGLIWILAVVYGFLVIIGVDVPKPAMLIVDFFEGVRGLSSPT